MSQLVFDNWLKLDGTPVTGATPPRLVLQGGRLTDARYLEVQQVYRQFCLAKTASVTNNLTADYEFADGTRVSIDSIQGVDSVYVLAPDDEGREIPPHGIGICFTGQESEPLAGFSYEVDEETLPLPFILVPGVATTEGNWPFPADNTWSAINVTRLVGGQQLWVHESGLNWASNFCLPFQATPAALAAAVIANPLEFGSTVNTAWVAASEGRIGLVSVVGGEPGAPLRADSGRYIFKANDTLQLNTDLFTQKAFFADLDLGDDAGMAKYRVIIRPTFNSLRMYRGPYAEIKGLAEEDADLSGDNVYLAEQPAYTPSDSTVRFEPNTLSVHPSGKFAKCIAYKTTGQSGLYADIAIGPSLEASIVDPGVRQELAGTASGPYTASVERLTTTEVLVLTQQVHACESTPEAPVYVDVPYERLKVDQTNTVTAVGTATASASSRELNRHYYDQAGNVVTEVVQFNGNGTAYLNLESVAQYNLGLHIPGTTSGSITQFEQSEGRIFSRTTIDSRLSADTTTTQTLGGNALAGSPLVIERQISNLDQIATEDTMGGAPEGFTVNATGNYTRTVRNVLFCDEINDFVLYLESNFNATVSGSKEENPLQPFGTFGDLNDLILSSGASAVIRGVRLGSQVFSHTLSTPDFACNVTAEPAVAHHDRNTVFGLGILGAWNAGIPVVQDTVLDSPPPEVVLYKPYLETFFCPGGNQSSRASDEQTSFSVPYYSSEQTGLARITLPMPAIGMSWVQNPRSYMEVRFARDPLTLACVVNLNFYGSRMASGENPDQTWSFAITKTAFKTMQQVMADMDRPLPDNAWIYPDATLHSLVSI